MAEVYAQKKKGVPWWAWLLGALVLGGIIWAIVSASRPDPAADANPAANAAPGGATAPGQAAPGTAPQ